MSFSRISITDLLFGVGSMCYIMGFIYLLNVNDKTFYLFAEKMCQGKRKYYL